MNDFRLNRALTQIDERFLTMVDRKTMEVHAMKQKTVRTKKIFRTILIAAVIIALLGASAYAISSIHAARQERLRTQLQIQENAVSGYTEYPELAQNDEQGEAALKPDPQIQLISSIQQGDFQHIFFSVSPVTEEIAHRFFFGSMEIEFAYAASNEPIPEDCWYKAGEINTNVHKSFSNRVPYTEGHEAEHMITMSSQTGLPDENGVQGTVTFEVVDPEWYKPLLMEYSYDRETESLMLMCSVYRKTVDFSKPVYLSVRCLDGTSIMTDYDTPTEEYIENYAPVYLEDYGTVLLEASDTAFVSLALTKPVRLVNPENNEKLDIFDIRLSANCVEWDMTYDDFDHLHNLTPSDSDFREGFEKQLQWLRFEDQILSSAYLTYDDGSTLQLTPSAAAPYENGVETLTSSWNGTIDIGKVKTIAVMGTTYSFPQVMTETVQP